MTIADRDRKRLWGQSAAMCAICRHVLIHPAEHSDDREALIGEEAHIISRRAPRGPRGDAEVPGMNLDGYYNLILLCPIHHAIVDEQTGLYTVEKLRELKSRHEQWVRDRLQVVPESDSTPVGLKPKYPGRGMILPRLRTGKDAWNAAIGSAFYLFDSVDEDAASIEACDAADTFLTTLHDCAEIYDAITDRGFTAIREAQRDLREGLNELTTHNLVAFGGQRDMLITGGGAAPSPARMAVVLIRPLAEVEEEDELPVAFPTSRMKVPFDASL